MESCQDHNCSRRISCRRYNINADGYGDFKGWRGCECDFYLPVNDGVVRIEDVLERAEEHYEERKEAFRGITGWA